MKQLIIILMSLTVLQAVKAQKGNHASLAIDGINGNQYGWAVNYNTQAAANKKALEECQKNGGNKCATVLWFTGGCGVYVVDSANPGLYGWGIANTKAAAEQIAKNEARARGGKNLTVRVWGCNATKTIVKSETKNPTIQGTFMFNYTKSKSKNTFYVSNLIYVPNVVEKNGNTWTWAGNAASTMMPKAVVFYNKVDKDVYSYLSDELRKKAITRKRYDWEGVNEVVNANKKLNSTNLQERKKFIESVRQALIKDRESKGYKTMHIKI